MPTPRQHGGSALTYIPLTVPAFFGLNNQAATSLLGPEWATTLTNSVIDDASRVASRKGYNKVTTTPTAQQFTQLFEYLLYDETVELLANQDNSTVVRSTDDGATWTDVSGTATGLSANMQFLNFNDNLIAVTAKGNAQAQYSGTTFIDLAPTGIGTGDVGLSAFGRVWITNSDNTALQYSALLDETTWTGIGTGAIDMKNIWPTGDNITAVAAFNGALVIFGSRNIAIYGDGQGSELGINPENAYLVDTISGIGCIARDSVQNVDGDLWFLSANGVQSLGRLIQEKSNPLNNLSKNNQDYLAGFVGQSTPELIRAVYSPVDRFYLLSLPRTSSGTESGVALCFDTRGFLEDGSARLTGTWNWLVPRAPLIRKDKTFITGIFNVIGSVGLYDGFEDDDTAYPFQWESGWIDITQQGFLIIPKRVTGLFFTDTASTVTLSWKFDFRTGSGTTRQVTFTGLGTRAEYSVGEWSISEFGGAERLREGKVAGAGTGEFIKLGTSVSIDGGEFAIQQLELFAKIGRFK